MDTQKIVENYIVQQFAHGTTIKELCQECEASEEEISGILRKAMVMQVINGKATDKAERELSSTMRSLNTMLYNASQQITTQTLHAVLDSIKRMLEEYQRGHGTNLEIQDHRKRG